MPTFCRHNRLVQNCPICAREQDVELRPVVSPGGRPEPRPSRSSSGTRPRASAGAATGRAAGGRSGGMTVRRLAREADDGYSSPLVPGIRSGADAVRLAQELAAAATRLEILAADPPGLYAEVAGEGPIEERTWLAVQIALLGPLQPSGDEHEPFAAIAAARSTWESGDPPALAGVELGPRSAGDPGRAARTAEAYRAWATRLGSQAAGLEGEASWTPERRFDRVFERLGSLAAMNRDPRYDLLVTLGRLGVYELRAGRLHVGGSDRVTLAAKRVLGIGDPMLLERRAADLAEACALPLEALDLGFFNWEVRIGYGAGLHPLPEPDPETLAAAQSALGLE